MYIFDARIPLKSTDMGEPYTIEVSATGTLSIYTHRGYEIRFDSEEVEQIKKELLSVETEDK